MVTKGEKEGAIDADFTEAAKAPERTAEKQGDSGKNAEAQEKWFKKLAKHNVGRGSSDSYFPTFQKWTKASGGYAKDLAVAGGQGTVNSIKDPGFFLFIFSGFAHIILKLVQNSTWEILLGVIFMFFFAWLIMERQGLILVIFFIIWYVLKGGVVFHDPLAMALSILPLLLFAICVRGVFNLVSQQGGFLQGANESVGLLAIAIFLVDLGLIAFLTEWLHLPLSPLLEASIYYIPWWPLVFLFRTRRENLVINFLKFLGIVYIVIILTFGIAPTAYTSSKSALPGAEEIVKAKQELREKLPPGENPAVSSFKCLWGTLGKVDTENNYEACVKKRQEDSQFKAFCIKEGYTEDTPAFGQCMDERRKLKDDLARQATGIVDPTIKEPTWAEIKFDVNNFPKIYDDSNLLGFPFELSIKNPRRQTLTVTVNCNFKGTGSTPSVAGKLDEGQQNSFLFSDTLLSQTYFCFPNTKEPLKGDYKLELTARLDGVTTKSRITRAFIGDKTVAQRDALLPEINRVVPIVESQAPPEFARINFWLGHSKTDRIIESKPYKLTLFVANVENRGTGKIVAIDDYHLEFLDGTLLDSSWNIIEAISQQSCKQSTNLLFDSSQKIMPLKTCKVTDYPEDLKELPPDDFDIATFVASLTYDYLLNVSTPISIKPVILP